MAQAPNHRRNPTTQEWETLVDGVWKPADSVTPGMSVRLDTLERQEGEGTSGGGSVTGGAVSADEVVRAFVLSLAQGSGERTKDLAHDAALGSGMLPWEVELVTHNNRWFFAEKEDIPPEVDSWFSAIDPKSNNLVLINRRTGEIRVVSSRTKLTQSFPIPGTDDMLVRFPDGTYHPIAKAAPRPGELTSVPVEGTDKMMVTFPDGSAHIVDKAKLSSLQEAASVGSVVFNEEVGLIQVTQPNGTIQLVKGTEEEPDIQRPREITLDSGQVVIFNPNTGAYQQVQTPADQFDPGVVVENGRAFLQQPDGSLSPLGREEVPNIDELIDTRIFAGDASGALALADFRDRPTSLEAFNAAIQFAQSPGDFAVISAISRGQSLVDPPPSGTVQRIAEQPEFLQDAYQRLINQFRGGTGSPEEFIDVLTRINKELADKEAALAASEAAQETAEEKNRQAKTQATIDKLTAQFDTKFAALENKFAVAQATAITPPINPPVVPSATTTTSAQRGLKTDVLRTSTPSVSSSVEDTSLRGLKTDTLANLGSGFSGTTTSGISNTQSFFDRFGSQLTSGQQEAISPFLDDDDPEPRGLKTDAFEHGGITRGDNLEIVGEGGEPELVDLPPGTKVTPISKLSPKQVKNLREMGIRGMQEGGITSPLLPFGVRRAISGVAIEPTRRRLSRAAGLPVLSAQGRQNLLPEELEVFNRLAAEAGIPEGAFRQEQESAFPGANLARGRARFAPRVLR